MKKPSMVQYEPKVYQKSWQCWWGAPMRRVGLVVLVAGLAASICGFTYDDLIFSDFRLLWPFVALVGLALLFDR